MRKTAPAAIAAGAVFLYEITRLLNLTHQEQADMIDDKGDHPCNRDLVNNGEKGYPAAAQLVFHRGHGRDTRSVESVSYTHLDVYKRQPLKTIKKRWRQRHMRRWNES